MLSTGSSDHIDCALFLIVALATQKGFCPRKDGFTLVLAVVPTWHAGQYLEGPLTSTLVSAANALVTRENTIIMHANIAVIRFVFFIVRDTPIESTVATTSRKQAADLLHFLMKPFFLMISSSFP